MARNEDGRLVIEKAEIIKERLRTRFAKASGQSLSSELIKERREETKKENKP